VGDEEDGLALLGGAGGLAPDAQQLEVHLVARHGVQRAEGLVHEENRRIQYQRATQRGPLLHAARELGGVLLGEAGEAGRPQELPGPLAIVGAPAAGEIHGQEDIVQQPAPAEQHRRLENHAHRGDGRDHGATFHAGAPRGGGPESRHHPKKGGFPAARGADEGDQLPAAHAERDAAQRLDGAARRGIGHADAVELDQHGRGRAPAGRIPG